MGSRGLFYKDALLYAVKKTPDCIAKTQNAQMAIRVSPSCFFNRKGAKSFLFALD